MMLIALTLLMSDIPLGYHGRYELFHTVYVRKNGSRVLVNEPYIPNEAFMSMIKAIMEVRKAIENRTATYIANETGGVRAAQRGDRRRN